MRAAYINRAAIEQFKRTRDGVEGVLQHAAGCHNLRAHVVRRLPNRAAFTAFVHSDEPGKLGDGARFLAALRKEFTVVEVERIADATQMWLRVGFEGRP